MKKITLLILVTEIILIVLCISLNVLKSPSCLKFERIKRCLHDKYIDPENEQKASDYFAHMETSFETKFMETVKLTNPRATIVRPKTGELSTFGIALLSMYQLDNKKTEYLTIVEDLIRKMDGKLGTLTRRNVVPWRDNWYGISVVFTRMLAMYEYIGTNRAIKDICHRRIVEITPKLNKSVGSVQTHVNFVYLAIPRLLTNYLYDRKQYDFEVKSELFSELHKELQVHFNPDYVVQNGIYQDYSCICHNNIPSFSYILTLGEFYLSTYKELGFKSSISNSIMKILHKVIHPKLDFIPYGLFGRDPKITCKETLRRYWPNYERNPNYDVNIFPFIGLGVFKSEKFVFSVRVQRDRIAAYEFDNWYQQFALGWLQMRKLYHTEIDYSKYKSKMEWDKLKVQPGVISFAEENNNSFEAFKDKRSTYTLPEFCSEIKSYIGHLKNYKDKKLLYWFNKYKFKAFYGDQVVISERGVCTDNGLVMRYEIKNQSGKALKLILKDVDIGNKMKIKPSVDDSGTGVLIPDSGEPKIVQWYQVFDDTIEPKTVDGDSANNSMSFTINRDMYVIEQHGDYHIVKCNGDIILAGNSSSLRDASITHHDVSSGKDTVFKRDSKTLMYVPQ